MSLGATSQIKWLREFYTEILVPPVVWAEVTGAGTRPGAAEAHAAKNQCWLKLRAPAATPLLAHLQRTLDAGEAEAIALATELSECLLLLDDADGRETALQMGLDFTGTIGVLLRAKRIGRLSAVKPVIDQLVQQHRFRLTHKLYGAVLRQAGEAP